MKIKKTFQGNLPENKVVNANSTSQTDAYSCDYLNDRIAIVSSTEPATKEKVWLQKGKNLYDKSKNTNEVALNISDGTTYTYANNSTSSYIEVKPNTTYTISKSGTAILCNVVEYNVSKTFVKGYALKTFTTSSTTKYIRFYTTTSDMEDSQMEQGPEATECEEYIEPVIYVKNDNGVYEEFIRKQNTSEVYSTEEAKIGTWIDGKPLYRRTVVLNGLSNVTTYTLSMSDYFQDFDIDTIRITEAWGKRTGFQQWVNAKDILINGEELSLSDFSWAGEEFMITAIKIVAEYTKITDEVV